jgi:anthranilate phosphoribosyltransferase
MSPCRRQKRGGEQLHASRIRRVDGADLRADGRHALLLRGTEGEVVADARRMPQMEAFVRGKRSLLQEPQAGTLTDLPELPKEVDAATTAAYIRDVLAAISPVPRSIALQVEHILQFCLKSNNDRHEHTAKSPSSAPAPATRNC